MEVFLFSGEGKNFINIIPKAETRKSKRLINLSTLTFKIFKVLAEKDAS